VNRSTHRTHTILVATLSLAFGLFGCSGATQGQELEADDDEVLLSEAEALTTESTSADPVADANLTDTDVEGAAAEAADVETDLPDGAEPSHGCGVRGSVRARIKNHFDKDGDGTLSKAERLELKEGVEGHPRARNAMRRLAGVAVRHHAFAKVKWAYDADGDGTLSEAERAELKGAAKGRCELRKEKLVAKFDADGDGSLERSELAAYLKQRLDARRDKLDAAKAKFDADGDGKLDEAERAALKAAHRARYEERRAAVKAKFDADGDGKLDEAEIAALKAAIRGRFAGESPDTTE